MRQFTIPSGTVNIRMLVRKIGNSSVIIPKKKMAWLLTFPSFGFILCDERFVQNMTRD
jgi:hypothetical protein